jgi:two-component system, NtrC family, nitrogen regulation response regulator NtrX
MKQQANLLIVDDELEIRELLMEFLQLKGYAVLTAANGVEALACLKAQKPDLALIDMWMPGMHGLDILRSIRAIDPSIGVIMMTGLCDAEVARQAIEYGAHDYLTKPLEFRRLEDAIRAGLTGTPHACPARLA